MRPDKAQNLKECTIKQGIAGITLFAFLLTQVVCPLPVSAQDTLRQEPIPEAAGLEELKDELLGHKITATAAASPAVAAGMEESLITKRLRQTLLVIEDFKQIASIGSRTFGGSILEKSADELKSRFVGFQDLWDDNIQNFVEYLREREQRDPPTELQITARKATARAAKIPASGIFFLSPKDIEAWLIVNPQRGILKQPADYYGRYNTAIETNPSGTSFPLGVFSRVTDKQGRTRKLIVVRNDLSPSQTFLTLAHEAVHFGQALDRHQIYGWKFYRLIIEAMQNDFEQELAGKALKSLKQEGFFETEIGKQVFPDLEENIGPIIRHLVVARLVENRFINSIRKITGPRALITLHRKYSTKALEKKLGAERLLALRDFFQIPTTIPEETMLKLATHLVLEDPYFQQPQGERLLAIPRVVTRLFTKATSRRDLSFPLIEYRNHLGEEPAINLAKDFVQGRISKEAFSDSLYEVVKRPPTAAGLEKTIEKIVVRIKKNYREFPEIMEAIKAAEKQYRQIPPELKEKLERWPEVVNVKDTLPAFPPGQLTKSLASDAVRQIDKLNSAILDGVKNIPRARYVSGTEILVRWNYSASTRDEERDLMFLADTLALLQAASKPHYHLIQDFVYTIQLGTSTKFGEAIRRAAAAVDPFFHPGMVQIKWPRPELASPFLQFRLMYRLMGTLVQEADHLRFDKRWSIIMTDLLATLEFRFDPKQKSPLAPHSRDPAMYLIEVDGHQAQIELWIELLRQGEVNLGMDEKKEILRLIKQDLKEVDKTLRHLESLVGRRILTPRGETLVSQQRLRQTGLRARFEALAGLEETIDTRIEKLAQAIPEKRILVINTWVVEQKDWLEELMRRIPADLKGRTLFFGKNFEVEQLADYYGIPMVPSDEVEDLAFELLRRPEPGDLQVGYLGDSITTEALRRLLPSSIAVSSIDPDAGLRELFLTLGVPEAVLDAVRADELEKALVRERAA